MDINWKKPEFFFAVLLAGLLFPLILHAEFYKYVDENGGLHFVDEKSKIPAQYRDNITVYKEKYDHLPEKEKSLKIRQEAQEKEAARRRQAAQKAYLKNLELIKRKEQQQAAREAYLQSLQTKVTIDGNRIMVPVKLGHRGKEVETLLLLDTGATVTTLHQKIANQLNITQSKRAEAKVINGKIVRFRVAKINYIKVGPLGLKNKLVGIIKHQGPSVGHNGLLGMDFLRNFEYSIDYENQVINWKP